MKPAAAALLSALLLAASPTALAAAAPAPLEGTVAQSGLLPVHVDAKGGRILF